MSGRLTLRLEWPGLEKSDLERMSNGRGTVRTNVAGLEWVLPLECDLQDASFAVRPAELPMSGDADAIYVRSLGDLSRMGSIAPGGGLHRLLCATDPATIVGNIEARLRAFKERLSGDNAVYIFGAHRNAVKGIRYCRQLGIGVAGLIDNDPSKQGRELAGLPILPLREVDRGANIIDVSGRHCVEINQQLRASGYSSAVDLMEFLFLYDLPFQAEPRFRSYVTDTFDNRLRLVSLYLLLAEDFSRVVLDRLLLFRLTLDSTIAGSAASPYKEEFFAPDVQTFSKGEVFVDGGAYDGDSYLRFAESAPEFAKAYLFEPDSEIYHQAVQRLAGDERVAVCNLGLWSRTTELRFSTTGGMDGAISNEGDTSIRVVAIDDHVKDKVTHIKLDVEGAEEEALMGAQRQIGTARPKMAVALYHRAGDLWRIPALIERLGGKYQYSIRHYSQTIDDSIVYARPMT
jgi:FkbM family methyltransferase